ncbi:hypothetical protein KEU06_24865 [Pseudaminobacter sp. 19-2017]|uniref:Uncharacterized protein n=1 Tax=Pseudaminobacter soli (ex Zhang et al. 2022) TaxID=2831468 RepID=A0A942IBR0_9HYPH|nr:hypothetical protein [Pseudaminobacter soli]MBS3651846.1 hypothetical protein [Pseudaminobacter soli]
MSKPNQTGKRPDESHYENATGGWGALTAIGSILADRKPTFGVLRTLTRQNKTGGHMCTSGAWTKPAQPYFPVRIRVERAGA